MPIELDDAGLVGAIRQRLAGLPAGEAGKISVEMEFPAQLPALAPAVYRTASEAIHNALTHSAGRRRLVSITANGTLAVTVRDDGRPPKLWTPGVALRRSWSGPRNWAELPLPGSGDGWEVRAAAAGRAGAVRPGLTLATYSVSYEDDQRCWEAG